MQAFNLVKVPHVSLPNLLMEEPLVPEFIQDEATAENLSQAVIDFLENPERCADIRVAFDSLRSDLARDADARAAAAVIETACR